MILESSINLLLQLLIISYRRCSVNRFVATNIISFERRQQCRMLNAICGWEGRCSLFKQLWQHLFRIIRNQYKTVHTSFSMDKLLIPQRGEREKFACEWRRYFHVESSKSRRNPLESFIQSCEHAFAFWAERRIFRQNDANCISIIPWQWRWNQDFIVVKKLLQLFASSFEFLFVIIFIRNNSKPQNYSSSWNFLCWWLCWTFKLVNGNLSTSWESANLLELFHFWNSFWGLFVNFVMCGIVWNGANYMRPYINSAKGLSHK